MERLSRSFDIVTQSYRILLHDKQLMEGTNHVTLNLHRKQ